MPPWSSIPQLTVTGPLILAHPSGEGKKGDSIGNLDIKLEKQLKYRGATLSLGMDVFNATNNYGGSNELATRYGITYGLRTYIKTPRTFMMTIRIIY